ncbi:MAG: DUF1499 domain-containing protein [Bradymonadaceae bacterium]|nr:DUF1499 domain-containing protein [Lujinxingiaceae bacterium]
MKRTVYVILGVLVALIVAALLITASIWPVISVVETGRTPQYPEIQPQYYTAEPERIYEEARAGIEALERWSLVTADPAARSLRAERRSRLGLTDDITVEIQPVTEFVAQVHVRSASRTGRGDLGQNARNIEAFFAELDRRLGAVRLDARQLNGDAQPEADEKP